MQIDGSTPSRRPLGPDPASGKRKAETQPGAKSFADALGKAKSGAEAASPAPGSNPEPSAPVAPGSGESLGSHIDTIRFRLQSGYYDSPKVNDALGEKLSGYFDDAAL